MQTYMQLQNLKNCGGTWTPRGLRSIKAKKNMSMTTFQINKTTMQANGWKIEPTH